MFDKKIMLSNDIICTIITQNMIIKLILMLENKSNIKSVIFTKIPISSKLIIKYYYFHYFHYFNESLIV